MTDIARLDVKLRADSSELVEGLKKATAQLKSFSADVDDAISGVAKNILGLYALKEALDFADTIAKSIVALDHLSHAVGVSVEALSQLSFAAKLQGVDDIGKPLENLARAAGQVAEGNQKVAAAFLAIRVSATDAQGHLKSTEKLFNDVADGMAKYADGIGKARVSQELFRNDGPQLIAFLDQGSKKIAEARLEAIQLGADTTEATAKAAEAFEQNMTRIGASFHGVFQKALQDVLPDLRDVIKTTVEFSKNTEDQQRAADIIATGFRLVATAATLLVTAVVEVARVLTLLVSINQFVFESLVALAEAFVDPIQAAKDFGEAVTNAGVRIKENWKDIVDDGNKGADAIQATWGRLLTEFAADHSDLVQKMVALKPQVQPIDQSSVKGVESAIEQLTKLGDTLHQQVATYGQSAAAALAYDLTLGHLSASVDKLNHMTRDEAAAAFKKLKEEGKLSQQNLVELNAAMDRGTGAGTAYAQQLLKLNAALQDLKDTDALIKLDAQVLNLTGHFQAAAKAASDLALRPLKFDVEVNKDQPLLELSAQKQQAEVAERINTLKAERVRIEDELAAQVARVTAEDKAAGKTDVDIAGDLAEARAKASEQYQDLITKASALNAVVASKAGVQALIEFRDALSKLFTEDDIKRFQAANDLQEQFKATSLDLADANYELTKQFAELNRQRQQGILTDIGLMNQQDAATRQLIGTLKNGIAELERQQAAGDKSKELVAKLKETTLQVSALEAELGRLNHVIRDDFEDAATNAFTSFAEGAKSASEAFHNFLNDIKNRLIELGSRELFQQIFGDLFGEDSPVAQLLNAVTGAKGASSGAATGATISTAMIAGGETAALSMQASIIAGGSIAATEMATAIAAAGATSSTASAIPGIANLFSQTGITAANLTPLAGGGPARSGQPYLVGEDGPELMVPDVNGTIVPNGSWGKGGATIINHFHIEAPRGTVSRATQGQIAAQAAMSMMAAGARNN